MVAAPTRPAARSVRTVTVAMGRYVPGGKKGRGKSAAGQAYDALRYMQMRELGENERPEDRRYFGAVGEGGSWQDARGIIMDHATSRVAFHRIIMSPGPGQEVADMHEWTRMVMDDLADTLGQELHWVAVVHRNTEHAHAHVLLAGGGERGGDLGGALEPVVLRRAHYEALRHAGDRSAAHLRDLGRAQVRGMHQILTREERRAERVAREAERINAPPGGAEKGRAGATETTPRPPAADLTWHGGAEAARQLARVFRQSDGGSNGGSDPTLDERGGPDR